MAMSLFSSFDALLAEKFGQKVCLSWATSSSGVNKAPARPSDSDSASSSSSSSSSISDPKKPQQQQHQQQQMKRRPRFAVELDGLHCFETIIPY